MVMYDSELDADDGEGYQKWQRKLRNGEALLFIEECGGNAEICDDIG